MLKFQIDDSELESTIESEYGQNMDLLAKDFMNFLKCRQVQDDISVSIEQISRGEANPVSAVM